MRDAKAHQPACIADAIVGQEGRRNLAHADDANGLPRCSGLPDRGHLEPRRRPVHQRIQDRRRCWQPRSRPQTDRRCRSRRDTRRWPLWSSRPWYRGAARCPCRCNGGPQRNPPALRRERTRDCRSRPQPKNQEPTEQSKRVASRPRTCGESGSRVVSPRGLLANPGE